MNREDIMAEVTGIEPILERRGGTKPARQKEHDNSDLRKTVRIKGEEDRELEKEKVADNGEVRRASHLSGPCVNPWIALAKGQQFRGRKYFCGPSNLCRLGLVPANFCCLCNHKVKHIFPHVCLGGMLFTLKASHTSD